MGSNHIRRNFYELFIEIYFQTHAFLQFNILTINILQLTFAINIFATINHRTIAETVDIGKINASIQNF